MARFLPRHRQRQEPSVLLSSSRSQRAVDWLLNQPLRGGRDSPFCCRPFSLPSLSLGPKPSADLRAPLSAETSVLANTKLCERENTACLSLRSGRHKVTQASEGGHLLSVAPSHPTGFAVSRKGMRHAGQPLPALAGLRQRHEPHALTAVAENTGSCPCSPSGQGLRGPERGAEVPAGACWAWGREGRTEGGIRNIFLFQQQRAVKFSSEPNAEPCQKLQCQGHPKPTLVLADTERTVFMAPHGHALSPPP